ncbi:unnamed protein product, partial [Discosporangium mesarthrocarpum]
MIRLWEVGPVSFFEHIFVSIVEAVLCHVKGDRARSSYCQTSCSFHVDDQVPRKLERFMCFVKFSSGVCKVNCVSTPVLALKWQASTGAGPFYLLGQAHLSVILLSAHPSHHHDFALWPSRLGPEWAS